MSKHLLIQYGDVILFSAPVEQISFSESNAGAVEVKAGPARLGGNMFEQLKRAKESRAKEELPRKTNAEVPSE